MTKVIILVLLFLSAAFCFIEIKDVSGQENNLSMMGDASMVNQTGTFPPFEKIYIINLKKRLDKRTAMEQRLKDLKVEIPVEFIEAVDGNLIDKKWLLDNNAAPLISWRDPKIKRPLTKGEIGCMLSHIKAWDMIIESGRSGLILEDDAVFSENFLMRVVDLKDDLTENYWELFYFYRQQLRDGEKRVGLNMVLPKYSYLTLSYAVTVEGAKKLRNTPIKQNLIPSDEYLSIMFGQCPLKRYTKLYDDYPKVRALAHLDNDLITPVETSYEDSDTEKSTSVEELFDLPFLHHIPELEDTYFVTVAHTNNIKDEGYRFFERSSNFYGISPLVVQTNEASNDFKIIQSVYSKLKEAHSKLPSPKSKLLVLVCLEAERSFFNADPYTIANSYAEFRDTDIVFASQITNPHKNNEREDFYPNTIHSWKFLSPNLFLSNYQYLVKLFESFLNQDKSNKKPFVDFAADIYFSNLRRAKLDFNCDLFQTIQRNNEILDIFPKNSQITNEVTYTNPQIFHWSLSGLNAALRAANMAGAWTQKKNNHPADPDQVNIDTNSPVSAYPTVFFSLHVHHHLPYLDQVIKHVSSLNYPFQKIHFWIQTNTANHHLVEPKLAPLIAKIKSQKGTYEIVEASPEINFLEARIESFKSAISSKQDLFFTTSSVLLDPNVLLRLVKTGKRAVAPLLNEKRRAFRANVWLNCTETGFYAGSSFYYKIVQSEYNGLWAVPVILNTYLLKSEVLPELASALERRNTQIQNGPIENLYADVEVSRQLTKQLVFPRLINQKSFGNYIQDYTLSLTDIFFRKLDEETWKKKYLVAPDNSVSQANSACSKPGARNNSPVVYRCNAYTPEFSHDFSVETKTFMGSNVHSKLDTSFKKNVFDHFFNDTCLSSFDFVRKHSNFQKSVFSFIAHKSYQPKSTSPVDFSVCNNFPKSCTDDLKAGHVLARMSVCNKEYKVPSLLIRIQLSDDHYLCHCMTPKTHMI